MDMLLGQHKGFLTWAASSKPWFLYRITELGWAGEEGWSLDGIMPRPISLEMGANLWPSLVMYSFDHSSAELCPLLSLNPGQSFLV